MPTIELDRIFDGLNNTEINYILSEIEKLPQGDLGLNMVDWATRKRVLPPELAKRHGPFSWDLVPHLIEPAMCLSPESPIRQVIVCKGVQIGATTGLIENNIGYTIDEDPCGLMYAREEKDAIEMAMELQVDAMLELSGLKDHVFNIAQQAGNSGSKSVDRKLFKRFPGGFIYGIGVNNAKKMRSNPIKKLMRDEIDSWNLLTIGKEKGDPMTLTEARLTAFKDVCKILDISTPLLMHESRIFPLLQKSDNRHRFVPCPFCGKFQELVWYDKENDTGFRYEHTNYVVDIGSTYYKCVNCKKAITENYKHDMNNAGKYIATNEDPSDPYMAGFFIPSFYSLLEGWDEHTKAWLKTITDRDKKERLKEFHNLHMAIPFEDVENSPKAAVLKYKQRNYLPGIVPNKMAIEDGNGPILLLTMSVDVHKNLTNKDGHLDVEILGHCRNESTYSIMWTSLEGDTEAYWERHHSAAYEADEEALKQNTWWRLEYELMSTLFIADDGKTTYGISIVGVDMSYQGRMVQKFCKPFGKQVVPIRGREKWASNLSAFKEREGDHGKYFEVIVDLYKDRLAEYMGLTWKGPGHPQPIGNLNYPTGGEYTPEYFNQYGGEHKVNVFSDRTGQFTGTYWKKKYDKIPNHAWDCRVYNMALLDIFVYQICQAGRIDTLDYNYVFDALEEKIGYKG